MICVSGDFGFTIRRAPYGNSTVVFAEPIEQRSGPPRPSDLLNGLLPGDQLLEVDGRPVAQLHRDQLLQSIQNAQQTIKLKVRVVPELAELCGRSNAADGHIQFLSPATSSSFGDIPEAERYWLIHSNGYTAAQLLESLPDGRAKILVAGQELIVDTQDIDRANPPVDDRSNDLAALKYLNETSAIHLLRQRLGCGLQFTNAGANSLCYLANACGGDGSAINENLVQLFKGCRRNQMPAHVFATAQLVYR
jgi:myosin-18